MRNYWYWLYTSYLFDATKVNNSSKGLLDLKTNITDFYRISDTTAIASNGDNSKSYFFDATKFSNGFTELTNYSYVGVLSNTTIVLTSNNENFLLDTTKINDWNNNLVPMTKISISEFRSVSNTMAIFTEGVTNEGFLLQYQ
ncbi:hypothetical protein [Spiroplasma endosymbiont of Nebria brevicollis]|uniref:hypothetical protein n=1 Tax=Spiroplasma endosymbiont of Nebria brevicollis TaxID=3066284 RepID=UPI00313DB207